MGMLSRNGGGQQDSRSIFSLRFRIDVTAGILSALAAGVLVLAFWMWPTQKELITFAAVCIGGAAAVTAAFYAGKQLELSANQQRATVDESKRLAALRFIEQWNSPQFFHGKKAWRKLMREIGADKTPDRVQAVRSVLAATEDQDTAEANLLEVLNFLEALALAVRIGAADEETAGNFFKTIVRRTYEHLEEWIKERRREVGPRVYQELEKLYGRWKG